MKFDHISTLETSRAIRRIRDLDFYKDDVHVSQESVEDVHFLLTFLGADGIIAHETHDVGYALYYPAIREFEVPLSPHFSQSHQRTDWKFICEYLTGHYSCKIGVEHLLHFYDYAVDPRFRGKNLGGMILSESLQYTSKIAVGFVDIQRLHSARIAQRNGWKMGPLLNTSPDGEHPSYMMWYSNKQ